MNLDAVYDGVADADDRLEVGGLTRFSTVDWPGRLTATVFCQGCGWRCPYCHNPGLLAFRASSTEAARAGVAPGWNWPGVLVWLRGRRGLLDGVVFSGGEPTLQPGLVAAVRRVRELGFRVGLHTGGPVPGRLAEVLPWLDWVGFDFKAPFANYPKVTGRPAGEAAADSLGLLLASGVAFEVRTTWHPELLSAEDLATMADTLTAAGVSEWVVQRFRSEGCADPALAAAAGEYPPVAAIRPGLNIRVR